MISKKAAPNISLLPQELAVLERTTWLAFRTPSQGSSLSSRTKSPVSCLCSSLPHERSLHPGQHFPQACLRHPMSSIASQTRRSRIRSHSKNLPCLAVLEKTACVRKKEPAPSSLRLFEAYNYLCAGMPLFDISDGVSSSIQLITLIDHRGYFSGFHEFAQCCQVIFFRLRNKERELLA